MNPSSISTPAFPSPNLVSLTCCGISPEEKKKKKKKISPLIDKSIAGNANNDDDEVLVDMDSAPPAPIHLTADSQPQNLVHIQTRKVPIPPHRFTPIKAEWPKIYPPLCDHLKLQVRMNIKNKSVEMRSSKFTTDSGALQKGEDFVRALAYGFDVEDAIALLRLDDLFIETFEIKDVKMSLQGDHLARAIGRIAGKDGKMRYSIENASRTRIVLAGQKVHILGGFQNIRMAREAVVSLVLGSPPGKVYGNLRTIASRRKMMM